MTGAPPAGRRVHGREVVSVDRHAFDLLRPEAMAVFLCADVRPLAGAAGHLDWRLCGALSRALESGQLSGAREETALFPATGRLGAVRLFVFGLGPAASLDAGEMKAAVRRAIAVLAEAKVPAAAWLAPASPDLPQLEEQFIAAAASESTGAWFVGAAPD